MDTEDLVDLVSRRADDVAHMVCECTDYRFAFCGEDRSGRPLFSREEMPATCPICCDLDRCPLCDT